MRILFITHELPPIGGGGGRAAWQIARRLARRGHRVQILTSFFQGLKTFEASEDVGIHRIHVRRRRPDACPPLELLSFMLRSLGETRRLAKEFRPDVACAFFAIPGGPAAWRLWKRMKTPYVVSLRGSDVPRPQLARHQRLHLITRPFLKRICRSAAGLAAVSEALREAAHRLDPGLPIQVIPNGVDTEFFRPHADAQPQSSTPELVFVGRLRRFKCVRHALGALPQIEQQLGRPVRFTIVGDGPEKERLGLLADEARRRGMASTVQFTGWLDQEAVRSVYEGASLLLLPSLVEGHPNVLLEAMAMGLPCVASDVPGIRGVLTHGREGYLVTPENPAALAHAAAEILGDERLMRRMGDAARATAETFSWEVVADRYESLLERAARRERETPCGT